jgi:hypothetical protein
VFTTREGIYTRSRRERKNVDRRYGMPKCSICKEEVDEVTFAKVNGRKKKVCEECLEILEEEEAIAEESESVVQNMMGFKGRR